MGLLVPRVERPANVETTVRTLGGVRLRVHRPTDRESRQAFIWIHGGGLIVATQT